MKYKVIAETAFSHEGDFEYLLKQIKAAHDAKADIVKFQIFLSPETYYVPKHPALDTIGKYIFNIQQWTHAIKYAYDLGLEVLALPLESEALTFCKEKEDLIQYIELHSVCLNEVPLLQELSDWPNHIVLGISGYSSEEIDFALSYLEKSKTILMFGFQSFPTDKRDLNLAKIKELSVRFNLPIGYADHTDYSDDSFHQVNQIALSLGAIFFEKHMVLEKGIKRIDFESAVNSSDILIMHEKLAETSLILGNKDLNKLHEKEKLYRDRRKKIVAIKTLKTGDVFSSTNIGYRVSSEISDIAPMGYNQLLGNTVKENLGPGQIIMKKDF
jgi:N,N'-diacetyllegionaminate synthase